MLDAPRVLANEQGLEVVYSAHHGQLAPSEARFPHAMDALVGVHHHKQIVAVTRPYRITGYICDLHSRITSHGVLA